MTRPPDPIRVRELLGHINQAAQRLRELGALPQETFVDDYRNTESAKYLFIARRLLPSDRGVDGVVGESEPAFAPTSYGY